MKKKILLAVSLLAILMLLSGCMTMMSGSTLEAMFGTGDKSGQSQSGSVSGGGDTVTVSREEYERYKNG